MPTLPGRDAADIVESGIGRRDLLRTAAVLGGAATIAAVPTAATAAPPGHGHDSHLAILQPGTGRITGDHYLSPKPDEVLWGYVPALGATPVLEMDSGETVTIDALSHEGILEDQGRDPVAYFASKGVGRSEVLNDAVAIAAGYDRTPRNFDVDGPHVVLGPIYVKGARKGDVLKVETLSARPRVPYGVVSSRHGKGALAQQAGGTAPAGISLAEVMPPVATDGRSTGVPTTYGNVSVFTPVESHRGDLFGVMGRQRGSVRFPLNPFMGMMGVASAPAEDLNEPQVNSIPPTSAEETSTSVCSDPAPPSISPFSTTVPCSTSVTPTMRWGTVRWR